MAAKPKLTSEEWRHAMDVWESDSRKGFPWLVEELKLPVSVEAVRLRSKHEGWVKGGAKEKTSLEKPKNKLGSKKKPSLDKVAKLNQENKQKLVIENFPIKKEIIDHLHGNSKYTPAFDRIAHNMCKLGATDEEMAETFLVDVATINRWKHAFPSFRESMRTGKIIADSEAAASLHKKACGYQYKEVKTKEVATQGEDQYGNAVDTGFKVVEVVSTVKEVPPDPDAAFKWLKNRRPQNWRDRVEVKQEVDITVIPFDQLREITVQAVLKAEDKHRSIIEGRYERLGIKREYQSD